MLGQHWSTSERLTPRSKVANSRGLYQSTHWRDSLGDSRHSTAAHNQRIRDRFFKACLSLNFGGRESKSNWFHIGYHTPIKKILQKCLSRLAHLVVRFFPIFCTTTQMADYNGNIGSPWPPCTYTTHRLGAVFFSVFRTMLLPKFAITCL